MQYEQLADTLLTDPFSTLYCCYVKLALTCHKETRTGAQIKLPKHTFEVTLVSMLQRQGAISHQIY